MRTVLAILLFSGCALAQSSQFSSESSTITIIPSGQVESAPSARIIKVEKLTDAEKKELSDAEKATVIVQRAEAAVRSKIAGAHEMSQSSRMEYSEWYEINGDFILQWYKSYQSRAIGW